jgi:predicted ATP-binding protein involved in virulence
MVRETPTRKTLNMSIEKALQDLTDAIKENTSRLDMMLSGAKAPAPSGKATATKVAETKSSKTTTASSSKKAPAVTADTIAELAGKLMSVKDAAEKKANKAALAKILAKYGAERLTAIDPEHFPEVADMLKALIAGEDPFEDEDEDEDEDEMV